MTDQRGEAGAWARPLILGVWLFAVVAVGLPATLGETAVAVGLASIALVVYAANLIAERRLPRASILTLALAAGMVWVAVAVAGSIDPRASLEAVARVGFLPLAGMLVLFDGPLSVEDRKRGLVVATILVAVAALAALFGQLLDWMRLREAATGVFEFVAPPSFPRLERFGDSPNVVGAVLALGLVGSTAGAGRGRDRLYRRVAWVLGPIALFFTLSRGAWLGLLAGLAVAALIRSGSLHSLLTARRAWLGAGLGGAIVLAAVVTRPGWLVRNTLGFRFQALEAGLGIIKEFPWTGAGPGMFALVVGPHVPEPMTADAKSILIHAHNTYVSLAAELGIVGALLIVALGVIAVVIPIRRSDSPRLRGAVVGGATAFAVHSLADTLTVWPATLLFLLVVVSLAPTAPIAAPRIVSATRWTGPALALVGLLLWAWWMPAWSRYDAGVQAQRVGDSGRAAALLADAHGIDPGLVVYTLQSAEEQRRAAVTAPGVRDVITTLETVARGSEHDPVVWLSLALIQAQSNDPAAPASAQRAVELSPDDGAVLTIAGEVLERVGNPASARELYRRALLLEPRLATSRYAFSSALFGDVVRSLLTGAEGLGNYRACEMLFDVTLASRNGPLVQTLGDLCSEAVQASTTNADLLYGAGVLILQSRITEAESLLGSRLDRDPIGEVERRVLGLWYQATGDVDRARAAWVIGTGNGDAVCSYLLLRSFDEAPREVRNAAIDLIASVGPVAVTGDDSSAPLITWSRFVYTYRRSPGRLLSGSIALAETGSAISELIVAELIEGAP